MELSPARVLLLSLVEPLVLPEFRVEAPAKQPAHLQREPRPELLELSPGSVLLLVGLGGTGLENVAVVTNEDVVSLVVEGDDLAPLELRIVREERAEEAPGAVTQAGGEVVEDQLRNVASGCAVVFNFLREDDVVDFEERSGAGQCVFVGRNVARSRVLLRRA